MPAAGSSHPTAGPGSTAGARRRRGTRSVSARHGRDPGAAPPDRLQVALGGELLVRPHHHAARDPEVRGQRAGRGEDGAGREGSAPDRGPEVGGEGLELAAPDHAGEVDLEDAAGSGPLKLGDSGPFHRTNLAVGSAP